MPLNTSTGYLLKISTIYTTNIYSIYKRKIYFAISFNNEGTVMKEQQLCPKESLIIL